MTPGMLWRGLAKFVAVVAVAGLAGGALGLGLADLTGSDSPSAPLSASPAVATTAASHVGSIAARPAVADTAAPHRGSIVASDAAGDAAPAAAIRGASEADATSTIAQTPTTTQPIPPGGSGSIGVTIAVLSARLGSPSDTTGHARVTVEVRVTNHGTVALLDALPTLIAGDDHVPLDYGARDLAGALLRTLPAGATATGSLRFTTPAAVAQRLLATAVARLRIANQLVDLDLEPPPAATTAH